MATPSKTQKPTRFAVVGAGWFAQTAVLPAFASAENSQLVAIVSGDIEKRAILAQEYDVPAYSYDDYEDLLKSGNVDAVYIVTPNSEHREHTLLAAKHGIHVLCEKPLADTVAAAREMREACDQAGVMLMTAYRLHFESGNLTAIEYCNDGTIGDPSIFTASYTQNIREGNTRLDAQLGGHPLLDIGIYCINAARYLFRDEPEEVAAFAATGWDPKFREVPEMVSAMMRFPGERLASIVCGFGEGRVSTCQMVGTRGDLRMDNAFSFTGERVLTVNAGEDKTSRHTFPETDQLAAVIQYFSECLQKGENPEPDAEEGLADLKIIEAMMTSMRKGMAVPLQPTPDKARPDLNQKISKPKQKEEPELVNAAAPSEG
jgi:predicted dehydrogenase